MNEAEARLSRCFSVVFPKLNRQQTKSASVETVEAWDSVAGVTLITVIEEEFGIQIDLESVDRLNSFPSMLDYLQGRPLGVQPSATTRHEGA
jgi:acyl carrier protein